MARRRQQRRASARTELLRKLAQRYNVPLPALRTFAAISDPANARLFTARSFLDRAAARLAERSRAVEIDIDDL